MPWIFSVCPFSVWSSLPDESKIFAVMSSEPVAIVLPSGVTAMLSIVSAWALIDPAFLPVGNSRISISPS